ncbi:MAG TPA: HRDC domain-containing protein, partial [Acidimicrobiia bacterium]|nr:HRDC domain-containing protein [Acidimicrobiia bacterium]
MALDTEFLWEKTYRPQLCLVQVAIAGVEATIDPLGGADLRPLWAALVGGPMIVVHAGAHDLDILHRVAGSLPARVADTQVAGAFLGYGEAIGYGNLVSAALRHQVRGGEGYTDWSRRPLSAQQQEYALEDVRHLLGLWDALAADLEQRGRTAWAAEETVRRFATIGDDPEPSEAWRRVTDARKLKGRSLAVLREVAAWREREAMNKDLARQRLVPDRVLIEVARRGPTDPDQIGELRGLHPGQVKVLAAPLIDAVRRAGVIPEADWPRWDPPRPHAGDPRVDAIASLLHAVVRSRAREMDLASGLLGSRADLEESARLLLVGGLEDADVPLLRGWRRAAVGEVVLRVLRGEVAVRVG